MIIQVSPAGSMDLLSQLEVERLKKTASSDLYQLYRNCSLAVLNSGSHTDNSKELLDKYKISISPSCAVNAASNLSWRIPRTCLCRWTDH